VGGATAAGAATGSAGGAPQGGAAPALSRCSGKGAGHSGISGSITQQAITNYHPNVVLLMIGTNDINGKIDIS